MKTTFLNFFPINLKKDQARKMKHGIENQYKKK
jgi:hypothetical protein